MSATTAALFNRTARSKCCGQTLTSSPSHLSTQLYLYCELTTPKANPLAILVNYACHPVVFGSDNLNYSSDFVGVMRDRVEKAFDQKPLCLFLQGADGDVNPYYATRLLSDDAVAKRDWTGRQLGDEAGRVAKAIHTEVVPDAAIDFADDVMNFELRWPAAKFREGLLKNYGPHVFEDHADLMADDPPPDRVELHVATVLLNKRIALIGMPGEPFVNFQINWKDRCPVPDAFFLGYANGYFDYFPTIDAAAQGGYGAGDSNTYVEVGAGERMLRQALVRVYEMLGKLKDAPERN
jgi:neutral ceramidase